MNLDTVDLTRLRVVEGEPDYCAECGTCGGAGQLSDWTRGAPRYTPCPECELGMAAMGIGRMYFEARIGDFGVLPCTGWDCCPPGWLITGPVGSGKTHLAAGLCREAARRGVRARFIESPRLLDLCRMTYDDDQDAVQVARERLEEIGRADMLVIDDLGTERATPFAQERLFLWIDDLYKRRCPVVVTSNLTLPDLEAQLGPRVGSRLTSMVHRMVLRGRDRRRR